eukprot:gene11556-biopygen9226
MASNNGGLLSAEKVELKKRFEMDDLEEINYCLGMSIKRDRRNRVLTINQNMYLKNVLKRFQMQDCKPISTPMDPNAKFMKLTSDDEAADKREYQAMIGSLTYASIAQSNREPVVTLSSTEAEYVALCAATQEAIWLRRLVGSLDINQDQATQLYEDNQGAIALSKNPNSHSRTKHIDIKYHYVRDIVDNKQIELIYCPTEKMIADIMTKPLPRQKLEEMRSLIGVEQLL